MEPPAIARLNPAMFKPDATLWPFFVSLVAVAINRFCNAGTDAKLKKPRSETNTAIATAEPAKKVVLNAVKAIPAIITTLALSIPNLSVSFPTKRFPMAENMPNRKI